MSDDKIDLFDDEEVLAAGERWDPLGEEKEKDENVSDETNLNAVLQNEPGSSRIKNLENDQEILITSLQSLTSHFAQIQFRLRQIVDSPVPERDGLLKNLEEFAFKGIPEVTRLDPDEHEHIIKIMENQRSRQFELIDYLKKQLTSVEKLAYESGADILPQSVLVEKQKVIIDELKNKLKLNVTEEELPQLSIDDLRAQVDSALGEFVQPLKMKETLVNQLKTQIVDLERFVAHLQGENEADLKKIKKTENSDIVFETYNTCTARARKLSQAELKRNKEIKSMKTEQNISRNNPKMSSLITQASNILNMFAATQLNNGNTSNRNQPTGVSTSVINHWGNLRAQLEIDVQEIISISTTMENVKISEKSKESANGNPSTSNSLKQIIPKTSGQKNEDSLASLQSELITLVRKQFCVTLKGLMQHGLHEKGNTSTTLMPFIGCFVPFHQFSSRRDEIFDSDEEEMHVWEFILEYYHIKNGNQYNDTPMRKLSESFNLEMSEPSPRGSSNKHSLLKVIGTIISIHAPYKRSYNSHFKAFISAALNAQKLTQWLNLIFQCAELIQQHYSEDSYVSRTGFRDALRTIDRLSQYTFNLPIDLAIKQFQNISDIIQ